MSSGAINKNFQNYSNEDTELESFPHYSEDDHQKNKFKFVSELMALLFKNKSFTGSFKNISNLVILALNNNKSDLYNHINHNNLDDNLKILKMIRSALVNSPGLTNIQRSNYCNIERFFMKLYLKEFLMKF